MGTTVFRVARCAFITLVTILVAQPAVAQRPRLDQETDAQFKGQPQSNRVVIANFSRQFNQNAQPTGPASEANRYRVLRCAELTGRFSGVVPRETRARELRELECDRLGRPTTKELISEFSGLSDRIAALSAAPSEETTAAARSARAQELRAALQSIIHNRNEYAAASKTVLATDEYTIRLRELEEQIPRLEEQARSEHRQALKTTYDAIVDEAKQLRARAGSQPARTLADWKQQSEALTQWEANVRERTRVRQQVTSSGESVDAFDAEAELKAIESRRAAIAQDPQRIELAQLKADLKELERRAGSQPARTLADWKQQGEALTQWEANVRERMRVSQHLTNAGESVEAFDAEAELKAIEGRRRAILQDLERIELARLNAEFKELEGRKIGLLDAYTRAFGTPAQRDSASRLLEHLRTMQANRIAAQEAGQTDAAGQIAQISKQIERIPGRVNAFETT
jgi:hypothetical protein